VHVHGSAYILSKLTIVCSHQSIKMFTHTYMASIRGWVSDCSFSIMYLAKCPCWCSLSGWSCCLRCLSLISTSSLDALTLSPSISQIEPLCLDPGSRTSSMSSHASSADVKGAAIARHTATKCLCIASYLHIYTGGHLSITSPHYMTAWAHSNNQHVWIWHYSVQH